MANPNQAFGQYYNDALRMKDEGRTPEEIDTYLVGKGTSRQILNSWADAQNKPDYFDNDRGIGLGPRLAASGQNVEGQLATFRTKYPSAQLSEDGRIIFMHPETGKWTYADPSPEGVGSFVKDLPGDTADIARDIAVGLGAGGGGLAGTAAGTSTGGPVGGIRGGRLGMGIGAGMAGETYDAMAEALGNRQETRDPVTQAREGAQEMLSEPLLQVGADKVLGAVPGAYRSAKDKLMGDAVKQGERARRHGVEHLTAGQVTGNPWLLFMEDAASKSAGGKSFREYVGKGMDETAEAVNRTVSKFGKVSEPSELGAAFIEAVPRARQAIKDEGDRLFGPITKAIGDDTRVPVHEFIQAINEMQQDGVLVAPGLKKFYDHLVSNMDETGQVSWRHLRKNRTWLGDVMDTAGDDTFKGVSRQYQDKIYRALSHDMRAAANQHGVLKKFNAANEKLRRIITKNKPILDEIHRKNYPDQAWNLVSTAISTGKFDKLLALKRQLTPVEWKNTMATVINKLGFAKPGQQNLPGDQFNWGTFATNWSNMAKISPAARRQLFDSTMSPAQFRDLQDISQMVFDLKDASKFKNFSNTAAAMGTVFGVLGAGAGGAIGGPLGAAGGSALGSTLGSYAVGRLLRSKRFVRWLSTATKIARKDNEQALTRHLARLGYDVMHGLYGKDEDAVLAYLHGIDNQSTSGTQEAQ